MLKLVSIFFKKISTFFYLLSKKILPDTDNNNNSNLQLTSVLSWYKDNGDNTLRLNYALSENSVVMDLGGYEGQWTADIFCKYGCGIYVFEPYTKFFENIKKRFGYNQKIAVYNYGLANETSKKQLNISAESSSIYKVGSEIAEIQLIKIDDFLNSFKLGNIDLAKINIEGGEYDLLEYLIQTGKILCFDNIQVQFHDFVPDAERRMRAIQAEMNKTHFLTYQYEFVWENWKRKD